MGTGPTPEGYGGGRVVHYLMEVDWEIPLAPIFPPHPQGLKVRLAWHGEKLVRGKLLLLGHLPDLDQVCRARFKERGARGEDGLNLFLASHNDVHDV